MSKPEFNHDLTEERLTAVLAEFAGTDAGPVIAELVAELRVMRQQYAEASAASWEADDDPEEWQRWAYGSGKPDWFTLPDWFLEKYPWMARERYRR